jgi:hypothetical protein
VVDVSHHRDHGRALLEILLGVLVLGLRDLLLRGGNDLDLALEGIREHRDRVIGERLCQRRHLAALHQLLDQLGASKVERLGDLLHGRARVDLRRLGFGFGLGLRRRLFEERTPTPSTAPAGRTPRRCLRGALPP